MKNERTKALHTYRSKSPALKHFSTFDQLCSICRMVAALFAYALMLHLLVWCFYVSQIFLIILSLSCVVFTGLMYILAQSTYMHTACCGHV
jgi:hypothetical protein